MGFRVACPWKMYLLLELPGLLLLEASLMLSQQQPPGIMLVISSQQQTLIVCQFRQMHETVLFHRLTQQKLPHYVNENSASCIDCIR